MATNAAYEGNVFPYTNTAATTIDANTVIAIPVGAIGQVTAGATLIGVALDDLVYNVEGSLAVEGVWEVTKNVAADTFAQGVQIGITSNKAVAATTSNLAVNARVYKASATLETTVLVKLS